MKLQPCFLALRSLLVSLHIPTTQKTLAEPTTYFRNGGQEDDHESGSHQSAQDRAWLREQLLAGKNSPLCDPISPTHFDELRARIRRTFANR